MAGSLQATLWMLLPVRNDLVEILMILWHVMTTTVLVLLAATPRLVLSVTVQWTSSCLQGKDRHRMHLANAGKGFKTDSHQHLQGITLPASCPSVSQGVNLSLITTS